ncbi:DUF2291 domain-containing protein [Actinomadura sp. WMMB 499]|uniref:DUF2291 domain-containing protein n=1 Tax=Actinomadura sp. WMMB 499 TaxID=1219491 RepID=UPI0012468074|nr:DUF2291 domain-containing protein [Actinomadura sp. WMMB 499]QFG26265.1 DUF2291 domain-containing protein [Actinomadura sp. WMMB 499]
MSGTSTPAAGPRRVRWTRLRIVVAALAVAALAVVVLDTKVVRAGSDTAAAAADAFDPKSFAQEQFPKVKSLIEQKAVDAATLATALEEGKDAATAQYAETSTGQPVFSVRFTGEVGEIEDGMAPVDVADLPEDLTVRVRTGPVINGTDVRDATGTVTFSQFTNQIEYQNAGAALNDVVRSQVLAKASATELTGEQVTVVGAFTLINPDGWLVTPVSLAVS